MKRITRDDLKALADQSPELAAVMREYAMGHGGMFCWEDALTKMVVVLHGALQAQRAMNVRLMERMPAEGITMEGGVSDGQVRRACDECHEVMKWLSVTNKGRCVCDRCSADWVVDLIGNVLIEPTGIGSGTGEGDVLYG